jgi:primosomal protein N'
MRPSAQTDKILRSVADFYQPAGCASVKETCISAGHRAVTDRLTALGVLECLRKRLPKPRRREIVSVGVSFADPSAEKAFSDLKVIADKDEYSTALLYRCLGRGKPRFYVRLVETVAVQGGGAIVLVPGSP